MRVLYIFVEGNTDKALIEVLLQKHLNFKMYDKLNEMPDLLSSQVPKYPKPNGSLTIESRPQFMHKENVAVMVCLTRGKDGIAADLAGRLKTASFSKPSQEEKLIVGIIQDRDFNIDTRSIEKDIESKLSEKGICLQGDRICYDSAVYECHLYILPASKCGAVESVLLELLDESHKELCALARTYREAIEQRDDFAGYRHDWAASEENQRLYADKVQVGAISAVLKPDSSPAMMVKDKLFQRKHLERLCKNKELSGLINFLNRMIEPQEQLVVNDTGERMSYEKKSC